MGEVGADFVHDLQKCAAAVKHIERQETKDSDCLKEKIKGFRMERANKGRCKLC